MAPWAFYSRFQEVFDDRRGPAGTLITGGRIDAPVLGEADAHAIVERGVAIARDAGFEAEPLLLVADRPIAALVAETAEAVDAPAIVMGTRGVSGLKTAVLGSVSREVVNAYHRPVVLV